MMRLGSLILMMAAGLLAAPAAGLAQTAVSADRGRAHATRTELQELLAKHELAAKSGAYSPQLRARARYEGTLIKQRLEQGDFQVGDRIAIAVDGEPTLSDTVIVAPDLSVQLSTGERIPLKNVLRSEIQPRITEAVARVVKNPVVHTESFMRIGITGAVGSQGYFVVKSEALLSDVLMTSGGISQAADLSKIKVERDRKTIWEGEALQQALAEGRTLDQLSLRAGDMLIVGQQATNRNWLLNARSLLFVITGLITVGRIVTR